MAKSKRTKKSKKDQISEALQLRIIAGISLFIIIVAALQLGIIGQQLHRAAVFCFGNFVGIFYAILIGIALYSIWQAKTLSYNGPKAVGVYLLSAAVLIWMAVPTDIHITGNKVITQYMQSPPLPRGGFIGAILYATLSGLFDYMGTIICSIFIFIIGFSLVFGKLYVQYRKYRKQKKGPKDKPSPITNITSYLIHKKPKFFADTHFNEKKEIKTNPLPVVDTKEPEPKPMRPVRIHQMQETKAEDNIPTAVAEEPKEVEEVSPILETHSKKINENYTLPPLTLLKKIANNSTKSNRKHALDCATRLTAVLQEFGVSASVSDIFIGPSITKYELTLETGTRVNKILQLQDDIKLALAATDIRIEAPIPGKAAVGVEIPNVTSSLVNFREVLSDVPASMQDNKLIVPLGKDVSGKIVYAALDSMPHLLIAGATGSGKSVCINTIICSILMRAKPDEVRLILVDPKKVELSNYNGIPHLLAPVVTDPKKAANVLHEVVSEMERRYELFATTNSRNITSYNAYIKKQNQSLPKEEQAPILAYHVIILDEVADLMMVASKDVEDCIMRISQMARAAGIHLIVATQRPSADIITGVIKANIPSRIAFAVSSSIDSRTILDTSGAERLLGKGDMLFSPMGTSAPTRVQGAYVSDEEVIKITAHVTNEQEASYEDKFTNVKATSHTNGQEDHEDEEYEMCRNFVIQVQKASTSLLQRQFRIGYNKAARIIDQLESDGVIGPQLGSKPREVLIRGYEEEL